MFKVIFSKLPSVKDCYNMLKGFVSFLSKEVLVRRFNPKFQDTDYLSVITLLPTSYLVLGGK